MRGLSVMSVLGLAVIAAWGSSRADADAASQIERGRYLISVSGCNDCYTPGYPESGGTTPSRTGSSVAQLALRGPGGPPIRPTCGT